jgi:hypothetical protein
MFPGLDGRRAGDRKRQARRVYEDEERFRK